jgi:hypothetical protein
VAPHVPLHGQADHSLRGASPVGSHNTYTTDMQDKQTTCHWALFRVLRCCSAVTCAFLHACLVLSDSNPYNSSSSSRTTTNNNASDNDSSWLLTHLQELVAAEEPVGLDGVVFDLDIAPARVWHVCVACVHTRVCSTPHKRTPPNSQQRTNQGPPRTRSRQRRHVCSASPDMHGRRTAPQTRHVRDEDDVRLVG